MIERDLNDSFPEDAFVTWTCPKCGRTSNVMMRHLETMQCAICLDEIAAAINADWDDEGAFSESGSAKSEVA
jgi:ribosomal protein S27E